MLPCSAASLVRSPQGGQRRSLLSKRHRPSVHSSISCKRYKLTCQYLIEDAGFVLNCHSLSLRPSLPERSGSPEELLQSLVPRLHPPSVQVEVIGDQALSAGLDLVRRADFDPTQTLSVRSVVKSCACCLDFLLFVFFTVGCYLSRFKDIDQTPLPNNLWDSDTAKEYFLKLLMQQIQECVVFEGPDGSKNLALDSEGTSKAYFCGIKPLCNCM